MRWLVRYISRTSSDSYYRTVWADSEPEARKIAERYARKGFIVHHTTGEYYAPYYRIQGNA